MPIDMGYLTQQQPPIVGYPSVNGTPSNVHPRAPVVVNGSGTASREFTQSPPSAPNELPLAEAVLPTLPTTQEEVTSNVEAHSTENDTRPSQAPHAQKPLLDLSGLSNGNAMKDIQNQQAPLLSPVLENRTPSPTASRRTEKSKAPQSSNNSTASSTTPVNGSALKQTTNLPSHSPDSRNANGSATYEQRNGISGHSKPSIAESSNNKADDKQWQQSNNKKHSRRKRAKSASLGAIEGQPLPANPAERKGG